MQRKTARLTVHPVHSLEIIFKNKKSEAADSPKKLKKVSDHLKINGDLILEVAI
jgi:hypothetical protein